MLIEFTNCKKYHICSWSFKGYFNYLLFPSCLKPIGCVVAINRGGTLGKRNQSLIQSEVSSLCGDDPPLSMPGEALLYPIPFLLAALILQWPPDQTIQLIKPLEN